MQGVIKKTRKTGDHTSSLIYEEFLKSKIHSEKVNTYFYVYEELFARFRGGKFTFVEVGISSGGSLFMWRNYFGPDARIIGIDFNPGAKKWEAEGFEIFIGDQADPEFWADFYAQVGDVDVLLDDGGHTNEQQIVTFDLGLPHIKNGGLLVVEDVHASYFKKLW